MLLGIPSLFLYAYKFSTTLKFTPLRSTHQMQCIQNNQVRVCWQAPILKVSLHKPFYERHSFIQIWFDCHVGWLTSFLFHHQTCVLVWCWFTAYNIADFTAFDAEKKSDVWRLFPSFYLTQRQQKPEATAAAMWRFWQVDKEQRLCCCQCQQNSQTDDGG